jgi:cell division septation protein DedD
MASTHDDSFREIQLSGKALVFLFMAVVVIAVGIFLMGLQVGRGVLAARGAPGAEAAAALETEPPPPPAAASSGSSTSPATAGEKLSYAERLGSSEPTREPLKAEAATPPAPKPETPAPAPAPPKTAAPPPAPAPAVAAVKPVAPSTSTAEPEGTGFSIQVAALGKREEADAVVKRLSGKGYPAYVVNPTKGTPSMFRVRVGKFKERREADTVAARLQKEEQFKPWIVR